jgi:hypothetical protein
MAEMRYEDCETCGGLGDLNPGYCRECGGTGAVRVPEPEPTPHWDALQKLAEIAKESRQL